MEPDTLQNMLADVMFFRNEPALERGILAPEKTDIK